jgi:hypothetical protein
VLIAATATTLVLFTAAELRAARIDMSDPRRALGRQDDIRVDAQLLQDTLNSSSTVGVTYRIQNLTSSPIALADKISTVDFDVETGTITLTIGAEVPMGAAMPHLIVIPSGEKRTLTTGAMLHAAIPNVRLPFTGAPREVQLKVCILRDIAAFTQLIEAQKQSPTPPPLPDSMFDHWVESTDTVFLNPIPVHWSNEPLRGGVDASRATADSRAGSF